MAKGRKKGEVENRAIYSRVSFLQQAATYLATLSQQHPQPQTELKHSSASKSDAVSSGTTGQGDLQGMARRLAADMRNASLKLRIRLSPAVKQTVCKFCDSVLIDGDTCTTTVENKSKHGRKPWADMLVRKCHTCGKERRYPVHAPRQTRRPQRSSMAATNPPEKQPGEATQEKPQEKPLELRQPKDHGPSSQMEPLVQGEHG